MTTHVPPAAASQGPGQYSGGPGPISGASAPTAVADRPGSTPWYRRLWVLITGGVVAVLLVFGSGYAAGVIATSMRGPGGTSFQPGERGQFPGGPGSGDVPDDFPGSGSTGSGAAS